MVFMHDCPGQAAGTVLIYDAPDWMVAKKLPLTLIFQKITLGPTISEKPDPESQLRASSQLMHVEFVHSGVDMNDQHHYKPKEETMNEWTAHTSDPIDDIRNFKKKDRMMNSNIYEDGDGMSLAQTRINPHSIKAVVIPAGPSLSTQTSLSAIARQVDPQNAAKRIDDMTQALNAFRKPKDWILVSPDGEMWAGDTTQLLQVLMINAKPGSNFV